MQDEAYKKAIQNSNIDMIDKSQDDDIDSKDEDYVMSKIRRDLSDSTVTIHLIGSYSAENTPYEDQTYIKRELQASLYDGEGNTRSGILGVVLPSMYDSIFKGSYTCPTCHNQHNWVDVGTSTTIKEFGLNYHIPNNKCCWSDEDKYCVLVKWEDFAIDPKKFIEQAFEKRNTSIANKVTVYPK
jgi:hypothetical protein